MFVVSMSVVSLWTLMNSWLTPSVLFVVLNIMIGTIAVTSGLVSAPKPQPSAGIHDPTRPHQHHQLTRSPSVLQRLRSNIKLYRSAQQPPPEQLFYNPADHTVPDPEEPEEENAVDERDVPEEESIRLEEQEEEEEGEGPTMEQVYSRIQQGGGVYGRSKSDGSKLAGPKKLPKRIIKKAASDISAVVGGFEKEKPVVMREEENEQIRPPPGADEGVDCKAEDFINKFREQQRLESLYGETPESQSQSK